MLVRVFLLLNIFVVCTLIVVSRDITTAISIVFFGVRPVGASDTVWHAVWYAGVIPVYVIAFLITMGLLARRERRARRNAAPRSRRGRAEFPLFFAGFLCLAVPYCALLFLVIVPGLKAATHADNWPADLQLAEFQVCAMDVQRQTFGGENAFGQITLEVVNTSSEVPLNDVPKP